MDFSRVVLNEKIKNYKALCELLGEKVKGGNAKKSQIKEMERYLELEKEGNGFYIKKIYDKPKNKNDNRIVYSDYVQKLILDLLVLEKQRNISNKKTYLSTGRFLERMRMVNDNYTFCREYTKELSEKLNVNTENVYEFYLTSYSSLQKVIESALKQLRGKALVIWGQVVMVDIIEKETGKREHRPADEDEKEEILLCEKQILEEMGYNNKRAVLLAKKYKKFNEKVLELLYEDTDINYYYQAYEIVFTNGVIKEQKELTYLLESEERNNSQKQLNQEVADKLHKNAIDRSTKAKAGVKVGFGLPKRSDRENIRTHDDYVDSAKKMIDVLIKIESPNIEHDLKIIRKKNNDLKK